MIRSLLLLVALLAAVAAPARADESPRRGSFELGANRYRPDVDAEFGGSATPYEDAFGSGDGWLFRGAVSWSVLKRLGTLDVGFSSGYFVDKGKGRFVDGSVSTEKTTFRIIPTSLALTYRLDVLRSGYVLPVMPYARFTLERYNWWAEGGDGHTSDADGLKGRGATHGYSVSGGLALLLDLVDRRMARDMDRDTGINHTYLFFDVTKSKVDDFGSSSSIDLSNSDSVMYGFGLMFVY